MTAVLLVTSEDRKIEARRWKGIEGGERNIKLNGSR